MHRCAWILLAVAGATLAIGCGGEPLPLSISAPTTPAEIVAKKLVGEWVGRFELATDLTDKQLSADERRQLESMRIKLTFAADGAMSMQSRIDLSNGPTTTGTEGEWEVVSVENDVVRIRYLEKDVAPEENELHLDGDSAFWTPLPESQVHLGKIRFQRR